MPCFIFVRWGRSTVGHLYTVQVWYDQDESVLEGSYLVWFRAPLSRANHIFMHGICPSLAISHSGSAAASPGGVGTAVGGGRVASCSWLQGGLLNHWKESLLFVVLGWCTDEAFVMLRMVCHHRMHARAWNGLWLDFASCQGHGSSWIVCGMGNGILNQVESIPALPVKHYGQETLVGWYPQTVA